MDHRDRAAPIALARDAPVAQAEIDLAGGDGASAPRLGFEARCDGLLGFTDAHPVEEMRIHQPAFADIGLVGYGEGRRIGAL